MEISRDNIRQYHRQSTGTWSPTYVVTQIPWLAGSPLIRRWKANEAGMQETQNRKEGGFSCHGVKLELIVTGCFCCQGVYIGLKAIRFKGDKAAKSYETKDHHIYLEESLSCLVSMGWGNVMEEEESFCCTPAQALPSHWLLLETGYLGLTNSWFKLVSILVIPFHVITLGNCLFIPTQAASIPASNYKEIRQTFSLSITCSGQKRTSDVKLKNAQVKRDEFQQQRLR